MNSLLENIQGAKILQAQKNWPKLYWAIDLHYTIIPSSKDHKDVLKFLGDAELALQEISKRYDQCIILWTATDSERIWKVVVPWLNQHSIKIDYLNENPECQSSYYARFHGKFYFDILLDDKAGFDVSWWKDIYEEVRGW